MITNNESKAKGFLVWGICALFFLYEFFLRTVIGTFQHPLMYDLEISSFQFSLLSTTVFLFIYGIMQIPIGLIVDHLGLKKSLSIGAAICAFSAFAFSYSYNYPIAILHRMFMGLGASFGFICLLVAVHDWMPRKYSALFIGLSQFIGTLGPMLAAGPLETIILSNNIDWHFVFLILGFIGIIILLLIILFVENNQHKAGRYIILHRPERAKASILRLFFRMQPWYIAMLSACLYFSVEYLSENEGRSLLSLKGIESGFASYMITISWLGYAIGSPVLGFLSDFTQRRQNMLILSATLGMLSISTIVFVEHIYVLMIAFFILGVSASGQSIGFAIISEQFKKQFIAVGFGLNNAMIMTLSSINAPLIGLLLDSRKVNGALSLHDYHITFLILIAISIMAFIISVFFIKETYCKSSVDFTYLNQ